MSRQTQTSALPPLRGAVVRIVILGIGLWGAGVSCRAAAEEQLDPQAVERGRVALTQRSHMKAEWSARAYRNAGSLWGEPAPNPDADPQGYTAAFARYYGLHSAPYDNEGLPMGLRWSRGPDGSRTGLQVDCMACHGGSILGKSYVGLPNTQVDYGLMFTDLFRADGRRAPLLPFLINSARGTTNAGMMSAALLSVRNPDLSWRSFPLFLGTNLTELDPPAWWTLKYKTTMYQDGRTPAASVRANMQFLLAEKSRAQFQELEPTFRDIRAYLLSLKAPPYPFDIDTARAAQGRLLYEKTCARCHGKYGPKASYPNKIIPLDVIGTDRVRGEGISDRTIAHYNASWFGEQHPANPERVGYQAPPLEGIWATAPYLHNGSVPTLHALLDSSSRPRRFTRPPSTGLEHYDTRNVGWKYTEVKEEDPTFRNRRPHDAQYLYDTARPGLGNQGHTFGDRLSETERHALIEYLKTL